MNKKYILSVILSVVLILQIFNLNSVKTEADSVTNTTAESNQRMSGIWVSTTLNLDYPTTKTTNSDTLKSEADTIINNCADMGITDIFFQVRPASDSFYKSDIYPWSQWLTGSQGTAPDNNFDPLQYWIDQAHSKGMKLHAWINPYRVTNNTNLTINDLAISNPARQHPEWVIAHEGKLYFDPAIPEVQNLVVSGVEEIVKNYNIDGIHLDDYFYPGSTFNDSGSYAKYGNGMDKNDWRRENVNTLVNNLHNKIKSIKSDVEFGISPVGVWANKKNNPLGSDTYGSESYYKNYADTRKWAIEGWIDYIAPQIYWEIGNKTIDYKTAVLWWADTLKDCNTKLYIGLADYKCDGVAQSSPWYNGVAINKQIALNKTIDKVSGEIHFRYKFVNNLSYLKNIVKTVNKTEISTETTTQSNIETTVANETENEVLTNSTKDILVFVDGNKIEFDQKPIIQNGRTLVPFRKIFEALNADVTWNNDTQQVKAKRNDTEISFIIGQKVLYINGKDSISMDVAPQIINGRSMVPLRVVSEALGVEVNWDNNQRIVTINTK